ncbi:MAG: hypothetical protein GY870_14985 [archaeon]|nr:hypothetical protein [archaeon]
MAFYVELDLPDSGTVRFGELGQQTATGNVLKKIKSISDVYRVINKNRSFENSNATIIFDNIDNYFSDLLKSDDRYIKKIECRIYDDETQIFMGKIYDILPSSPAEFIIVADSKTNNINEVINRVIKKSEFPNVPANNEGKYANIIYGTASDSGSAGVGITTAYRVDTNKYLAAWNHLAGFQSPYTGTQVFALIGTTETNVTGSCTFTNAGDGYAYINYTSTADEIFFNSTGKMDGGLALITNPAWQLFDLNTFWGSPVFTFQGFGAASTIYNNRGYTENCIIINDGMKWGDFFEKFCLNFDCYLYQRVGGKIGIKVLEWGSVESELTINENFIDFRTFQQQPDISEIINEYQRGYWYHYRKNYFQRLPSDIVSSTQWLAENKFLDLRYHRNNAISSDVASRKLYFDDKPKYFYISQVPKDKAKTLELSDVYMFRVYKSFADFEYILALVLKKIHIQGSNLVTLKVQDISAVNPDNSIRLWELNNINIAELKSESDPDCHILI